MSSFLLSHFLPLLVPIIAGAIAAFLHARFSQGTSWYAGTSRVLQLAIGVIITVALTALGTLLPIGGLDAARAACPVSGGVLSQACLDALGALFTKENVSAVIGVLIALIGHVSVNAEPHIETARAKALRFK